MGSAPPPKPSPAAFFPAGRTGSSRPLRFKKAFSSGAPHRSAPSGFGDVSLPITVLPSRGDRLLANNRRGQDHDCDRIALPRNDNGTYKGQLRTVSIRADIDIIPNRDKTAETHPDFRVLTQNVEIGAGWIRRGESSGKEYVSLSLAAPEFGPRKLYANLGRAAGQDDDSVFALIWNPAD